MIFLFKAPNVFVLTGICIRLRCQSRVDGNENNSSVACTPFFLFLNDLFAVYLAVSVNINCSSTHDSHLPPPFLSQTVPLIEERVLFE